MSDENELCKIQKFLTTEDFAMLFSFNETVSDGKEYINDKEDVQRMAELGVIQNLGFGRYRVTSFGHWLIESEFHQSPSLPLKAGRQS